MSDRYFVESPITSDRAVLSGAEAHHLLHVMRADPGTQVTLFDGSGWEFQSEVRRAGRAEVELAILARQEVDREAACHLTLGVALPKGDRQKWLVEKATELGVARLVPLETERSVAQPSESTLQRLRRAVIEASKQCGRNRLMEVAAPRAWEDFLAVNRQRIASLCRAPRCGAAAMDLTARSSRRSRRTRRWIHGRRDRTCGCAGLAARGPWSANASRRDRCHSPCGRLYGRLSSLI